MRFQKYPDTCGRGLTQWLGIENLLYTFENLFPITPERGEMHLQIVLCEESIGLKSLKRLGVKFQDLFL